MPLLTLCAPLSGASKAPNQPRVKSSEKEDFYCTIYRASEKIMPMQRQT